MSVNVIMPQMGESIFEGTVTKWLKKPGEKIERDEPLFEISTDKVDAEIPSPASGVLQEIIVGEGQTVPIQTVVGVIASEGAAVAAPAPTASTAPSAPSPAPAAAKPAAGAPAPPAAAQEEVPTQQSEKKSPPVPASTAAPQQARTGASSQGNGAEKVRSSPLVRRLAREHNIDVSQLSGTGRRRPGEQAGYFGRDRVRSRNGVNAGRCRTRGAACSGSDASAQRRNCGRLPWKPRCLARRCTSGISRCSR